MQIQGRGREGVWVESRRPQEGRPGGGDWEDGVVSGDIGEHSSLSVMQLIAMLAKDMPERSRKIQ